MRTAGYALSGGLIISVRSSACSFAFGKTTGLFDASGRKHCIVDRVSSSSSYSSPVCNANWMQAGGKTLSARQNFIARLRTVLPFGKTVGLRVIGGMGKTLSTCRSIAVRPLVTSSARRKSISVRSSAYSFAFRQNCRRAAVFM